MLLALCVGNLLVTGEFPAQRPVTQIFDVFFDLHMNKGWVNNLEAGDLRSYCAYYDLTVMHLITTIYQELLTDQGLS